jgi:hypothetical protein
VADFSDNFNRSNGSIGSNYTDVAGGGLPTITSNQVSGPSGVDYHALVNAASPAGPDHKVEITHISNPGDGSIFLWNRLTASGTSRTGYMVQFLFWGTNCLLYRVNANALTLLTSVTFSASANDTLGLRSVGTSIDCLKNGSSILNTTDSNITGTGSYGFGVGLWYTPMCVVDDLVCTDIVTVTTRRQLLLGAGR